MVVKAPHSSRRKPADRLGPSDALQTLIKDLQGLQQLQQLQSRLIQEVLKQAEQIDNRSA